MNYLFSQELPCFGQSSQAGPASLPTCPVEELSGSKPNVWGEGESRIG